MPPITLHMVLANQVAAGLDNATLLGQPGAYLLGSTTPDIRVITRQDRFSTHFFDLNGSDHQDSVAGFLAANERLIDPSILNAETTAWVCGYLAHLVMDEQYITQVFRPYFADHDRLGGRMRASVMDRLLQFDLDRAYGEDPAIKRNLIEALSCTVEGIDCGFIDHETLERWRLVSLDVAGKPMDWDRMRGMISNHLRFSGLKEQETLGEFLDSLPAILDATIAHITNAEIEGFVQRATAAAAGAVERYLRCG